MVPNYVRGMVGRDGQTQRERERRRQSGEWRDNSKRENRKRERPRHRQRRKKREDTEREVRKREDKGVDRERTSSWIFNIPSAIYRVIPEQDREHSEKEER